MPMFGAREGTASFPGVDPGQTLICSVQALFFSTRNAVGLRRAHWLAVFRLATQSIDSSAALWTGTGAREQNNPKDVLIPIDGKIDSRKSTSCEAPLQYFRVHHALVIPRLGAPVRARTERLHALSVALVVALLAGAVWITTGCGGVNLSSTNNFAAISATASTVRVNQQVQLVRASLATGAPLTYYVNGIQGGNAELGTVDSNGLYTAPAIVPVPDNSVTITSTAPNYPNLPPGSVTLAVLNPIPIIKTVAPSGFSEGTTTVAVSGSQFVYGAQILWNGASVQTTLVSDTQLAAVIAAPNPGTYPLVVSNPNPGSANSATVPVVVGPGQVVLTLQPGEGTDVRVGNTLNLALTVAGTNHTGVTLQVNGNAGGNSLVGTATSLADGSINYVAPLVVPTPSNVVQLTITSVDNPKVSIGQNISVLNPIPILNSATPTTLNVGPPSTSVVLTGKSFINGAQVLVNGSPALTTTFNSGTQLTATVSPAEPGNLDLQVLNPSPGPATSADLIAQVNGTPPTPVVSPEDASRFLEQATLGATDPEIHRVSLIGYQAWLDDQFAMKQTPQEPTVEQALILNSPACAASDVKCNAALFVQNSQDEWIVQGSFWQQSLAANDQLRQRVKYALTSLFVISSEPNFNIASMPRGEASYYDMLGADAFGNFRTLLQDVTLSPMMGQFLNMLGNDKGNANTDPDENYAREVMQLFTVGLYLLNDDGSQKLDSTGRPIPTYSNTDVMGLAKVFTGFSWNIPGNDSDTAWSNCCLYVGTGHGEEILPMQSFASHHSTAEKQFLGRTIPAGSSDPDRDLKIALDTIFNHPNLPPFFCKQMIQHLVTSNPSPTYIGNCSSVFKNDGTGVRGNLKAVIAEILLDPEARDSAGDFSNPQYGKVREALLRYTEWARAFTAQSRTGSYDTGTTEDPIWALGEMWLRSPTVFNWFAPGYVPPGTSIAAANLTAPEMQMTNVSTVVGYLNYMQTAIGGNAAGGPDIFSSYETEMKLAATPTALLDRINLLLMAGEMDGALQTQILAAINAIDIPSGDRNAINAARLNRVQTAIYLTMASPAFNAQF